MTLKKLVAVAMIATLDLMQVSAIEVAEPSIPDYTIALTDFGAIGDGHHDNSEAFRQAMSHLKQRGGGHLTVPAGIWLTGPIALESHVDLHLDHGSLVLFSDNRNDYPLFKWDVKGNAARECVSPISAFDKHDIAITGHGTFNGRGEAWRPVKKAKLTDEQWKKLCRNGVVDTDGKTWYPSESIRRFYARRDDGSMFGHDNDSLWAELHDFLRPVMVLPVRCERVLLEGVTFENSPRWNVRPLLCTDVTVRGVTVRNPSWAQNGDGLDIESCRNVHVSDCTFDVGDDAICLKSGRDREGRERGVPTENVLIDNCKVYRGHGGFVIGSEMSGGIRDIKVRDCVFEGTDSGIKFKSTRGRGGLITGIDISGIMMSDIIGDAITIDMYYGRKGAEEAAVEVSEETPVIDGVTINAVACVGAARAVWINGLPEMPVRNISISNSVFTSDSGMEARNAESLKLSDVTINAPAPAIITHNVTGLGNL